MASGRIEPLPWWVSYFIAARHCQCPPWELIEAETPRQFWLACALILADAEERIEREHARRERRM